MFSDRRSSLSRGLGCASAGEDVHLLGDDGHVFALSSFLAHEQMHKSCFVIFSISEVAVVCPECNPAVALTNE